MRLHPVAIPAISRAPVEYAALEGALDEAFWAIIGPLIADAFDLISDITPEAVANALEAYARTIWIGIWSVSYTHLTLPTICSV